MIRALVGAKSHDKDLAAEHQLNTPGSGEVSRPWLQRCEELTRFIEQEQRLPSARALCGAESGLGRWLAKQRAAAARGELSEQKHRALDQAGDWQSSPRAQGSDRRWDTRLVELEEFVASERRLPSYRRASTECERVLRAWLRKQGQDNFNHRLAVGRLQEVSVRVPGWNTWRLSQAVVGAVAAARTSSDRANDVGHQ